MITLKDAIGRSKRITPPIRHPLIPGNLFLVGFAVPVGISSRRALKQNQCRHLCRILSVGAFRGHCSGKTIDNQVQQSAHTRQAAEVAMIAYERLAFGGSLTNIDRNNAKCGVTQRAG